MAHLFNIRVRVRFSLTRTPSFSHLSERCIRPLHKFDFSNRASHGYTAQESDKLFVVLLLLYTADEPDGSEDPFSAPASAAAQINPLDPYRPPSLVLNCQTHFFSEYATVTTVLMQDTYIQ